MYIYRASHGQLVAILDVPWKEREERAERARHVGERKQYQAEGERVTRVHEQFRPNPPQVHGDRACK